MQVVEVGLLDPVGKRIVPAWRHNRLHPDREDLLSSQTIRADSLVAFLGKVVWQQGLQQQRRRRMMTLAAAQHRDELRPEMVGRRHKMLLQHPMLPPKAQVSARHGRPARMTIAVPIEMHQ